jgi:hypothetical protein
MTQLAAQSGFPYSLEKPTTWSTHSVTVSPPGTEDEEGDAEEGEETLSWSKERSSSFINSSRDETADILSLRLPPFQPSSRPEERADDEDEDEDEDEDVGTRGSVSLGTAGSVSAMMKMCCFLLLCWGGGRALCVWEEEGKVTNVEEEGRKTAKKREKSSVWLFLILSHILLPSS